MICKDCLDYKYCADLSTIQPEMVELHCRINHPEYQVKNNEAVAGRGKT